MLWRVSWRADPAVRVVADRHYSRQSPGHPQFVKPGRCLVLHATTRRRSAYWVTSWQAHTDHEWPGAWECAAFRNEGVALSSALVRDAVAATRWRFGEPPAAGLITMVDPTKVKPKADPGRCFLAAGFEVVGKTKSGLIVLGIKPSAMPDAHAPVGAQESFDLRRAA